MVGSRKYMEEQNKLAYIKFCNPDEMYNGQVDLDKDLRQII